MTPPYLSFLRSNRNERDFPMKKFMQTQFGKRLPAALIMFAASVGLGFLLKGFVGPETAMWQRGVFCVACLGTGLGSLLFFLSGRKGLLGSYGFVLALFLIKALPDALPEPWNRYAFLALLVLLIGGSVLLQRREKKRAQAEESEVLAEEEEAAAEEEEEENALHSDDTLLVHFFGSDRNYQLIRTPGELRAYRVGGELRGIDEALVQDTKKPLRSVGKKDLVFPLDETFSVSMQERYNNLWDQNEVVVTLRSGRHKHRMNAYDADEQVRAFFAQCTTNRTERKSRVPKEPDTAPNSKRVALLRKVNIGLAVFTGLVDLPWLFLQVPYRLFAVPALLPALIVLALCCIFPNDTTLAETKKAERTRASFLVVLLLSAIVPTLRTLLDFNFLSWKPLLLISLAVFAVLLSVVLALTKEWHAHKSIIFVFVMILAYYSLGFSGQMNYLLDRSQPTEQAAVVEEMKITTSSNSPDSYYLTVRLGNGTTEKLEVGEKLYKQTALGDTVTVETYSGGLGVPYAFVR